MIKYLFLITIIIFIFTNLYAYDSFYLSQNDPKSYDTIDNSQSNSYIEYKNKCNIILGVSYGSAMVGCATGIIGGLFWAFYPKNRIASMASCLTGCSLFVLGTTTGLFISNIYCKHYSNVNGYKFYDKYDLVLNIDVINKNYLVGFSLKY